MCITYYAISGFGFCLPAVDGPAREDGCPHCCIRYRIRHLRAVVPDGSIERVPEPVIAPGRGNGIGGRIVRGPHGSDLREMFWALVLMRDTMPAMSGEGW